MDQQSNYFDVIIVGAGLSGIGAAHHLKTKCPDKSFILLEAREAMGGTWDLFRYPGIRSDSDMFTLGYSFKPWIADEAIADGPAILDYINETAKEDGTAEKIRYKHKVINASWSSDKSMWTMDVDTGDQHTVQYRCNFLFMCSGYYDYDKGYTPDFEGMSDFSGTIVHPQKWPQDLDYSGAKIVVIGSGATAVTLVPELAKKASHVTMLQRSPTYIITAPEKDKIANFLRKILPKKVAYAISRWKNILFTIGFFNVCKMWPKAIKGLILKGVKKEVGRTDLDLDKHFSPDYDPWDQRLCLVPDSDLFKSLKEGSSEVVTDHIDRFTQDGILLKSGKTLEADVIVTATGLNLKFMGGMTASVDGKEVNSSELYCYRGMMYSSVPNLAQAFGYTNASWTLKCDLTCDYVCRLLNYMDKKGLRQVTPQMLEDNMIEEPFLNLTSNYILRSEDILPKQGSKRPWKLYQNYALDILNLRFSKINDKALEFK